MDPQAQTIYSAILIASVIIGVILIFFFISIFRQQKRNQLLSRENMLMEITAMEKERARIASDLHDDMSPILSVIKFNIDGSPNSDHELLVNASHYVDELLKKMREISQNLLPGVLERKGLITGIEEYLEQLRTAVKTQFRFKYEPISPLSHEKTINIYRIIQEACHNSIKHSHASLIEISIQEKNKKLIIIFKDNGIGFDYDAALLEKSGMGLRSFKRRTELMGGQFYVESRKGIGTALSFEIPLD